MSSWKHSWAYRVALTLALGAVTGSAPCARAQDTVNQESAIQENAVEESKVQESTLDDRAMSQARSLSLAFRRAAEKALPSVVKILCVSRDSSSEPGVLAIIGGEDPERFDSVGSGVLVNSEGLILTNHHVIKDAKRILVRLSDGREFEGVEPKSDAASDLAIIKIEAAESLPQAEFGDSEGLHVGDWVLAIGSPFMLDSSVSAGIISSPARRQDFSQEVSGQFLQTDAAINPGNSGGPLLDLDGRVVGINTAISSRTGGWQGIGFAIPISRASWIMKELLEYGKVRRGIVGVRTTNVPYDLARQLKLPRSAGAMVSSVTPGRPGQRAGLKSGDIIVEFAGQSIASNVDFREVVQQSPLGKPLSLTVVRDGEQQILSVELEESFGP